MPYSILSAMFLLLGNVIYSQTWRSQYYPENWTPPTNKKFYTDAFLQDYSYAGYQRGEKSIPPQVVPYTM